MTNHYTLLDVHANHHLLTVILLFSNYYVKPSAYAKLII
jgi:hypothetical protein